MIAHMDSNNATYLRVGRVEHDFGVMLTWVPMLVAGLRIYVATNTGHLDFTRKFRALKLTWESCSEPLSGPLTCGNVGVSILYKCGSACPRALEG